MNALVMLMTAFFSSSRAESSIGSFKKIRLVIFFFKTSANCMLCVYNCCSAFNSVFSVLKKSCDTCQKKYIKCRMHMLCIFYVQKIDNNMCFLASWMACAFCKKSELKEEKYVGRRQD